MASVIAAVTAVVVLLTPATALAQAGSGDAAALRTSQAAIGRQLGDHVFTDQDGQALRMSELRGQPLVLNLVYTNCYYICSGLTVHLRDIVRIAEDALGTGRFSVLTVGFDTAHDSPASMRNYGLTRGINQPDWHFASADPATIRRLTDEIGFTWAASPRGFDHVTQVTLVDAGGRVVEQVYGQDFAPPALVEPLKQLVLGGKVSGGTVQGILDRVKLLCTVYDPVAGRYRFDYAMLASSLPAILALGMLAIAILLVSRKAR